MAVTAEQLEGSRFLRVRDDRDPDFHGSASVQGNIGTQKSLMAGEYLFLGGRHDILSLCDRDGAIARASHRGLLVCQNGVWGSAGAGGGGFSTNSMPGCQAPNGSSTSTAERR